MFCVRCHACVMIIEQWAKRSKEEKKKKSLVVLLLCHSAHPHSPNTGYSTPEAVDGLIKKCKVTNRSNLNRCWRLHWVGCLTFPALSEWHNFNGGVTKLELWIVHITNIRLTAGSSAMHWKCVNTGSLFFFWGQGKIYDLIEFSKEKQAHLLPVSKNIFRIYLEYLKVDSYWSGPSGAACLLLVSSLFRLDRGHLSTLCGGKLLGLRPYPLLIVHPVLTVNCVSFCLCWILNVWLIQQLLDSQKNLFDGDSRSPIFVLLQDGQTHSAWWVDIWVEYWWLKLAFGWRWRVVILEQHSEFIQSSLPQCSFLPWDGTLPVHQVHGSIRILSGHSNKPKRVVFSPGFALLGQSAKSDARHYCSSTPPSCFICLNIKTGVTRVSRLACSFR